MAYSPSTGVIRPSASVVASTAVGFFHARSSRSHSMREPTQLSVVNLLAEPLYHDEWKHTINELYKRMNKFLPTEEELVYGPRYGPHSYSRMNHNMSQRYIVDEFFRGYVVGVTALVKYLEIKPRLQYNHKGKRLGYDFITDFITLIEVIGIPFNTTSNEVYLLYLR